MVRILRDEELRRVLDLRRVVARIEDGYRSDARGDIVILPRSRVDTRGTCLAWLGAAVPGQDLLGFRSYLYGANGEDSGQQVVALYAHGSMALRALFIGQLVGNLRTGASIAAALHLADPADRNLGMIGTGYQARNALACLAAIFRPLSVVVWSPSPEHRSSFVDWARAALDLEVEVAADASRVVEQSSTVAVLTTSETPVVTAGMVKEPKLLISITAYRRPEIDDALIDRSRFVWTDSVVQASGPGTRFERAEWRSKLRPLASGLEDGTALDPRGTRIVVNTGAAWQEVVAADILLELATEAGVGTEVDLTTRTSADSTF
jgi:alanine dehydrogenase